MATVTIKLDRFQLLQVALVGAQRQVESIGRASTADAITDLWGNNIEAAASELALSIVLDRRWPGGVNTHKRDPDVGDRHEARWTPRANGRLLCQHKDIDERWYWHVTGAMGTYQVHGYMPGAEAKSVKYWDVRMPEPCFAVPAGHLYWNPE